MSIACDGSPQWQFSYLILQPFKTKIGMVRKTHIAGILFSPMNLF